VLESGRPRGLRQLGIGPGDGSGSWVSIRAYDPRGPWAERSGFGDDVAAAAGSVVSDSRGAFLPVGDAIADPLAGACAAVAGLAALVGAGRWGVETSLAQALSGVSTVAEGRAARREGRRWVLDTASGVVPIARPRARSAPGVAAAAGADNRRLLAC
jgi:crotonobetainyl-CoA:carnitine CoA-transferase CaiB-like acyl-CoA transferase